MLNPCYSDNTSAFYEMDCLDGLKDIPDNSIDLLCTDPPYGLAFMGLKWDKAVPPVDTWKQCLRVLKPGAFGFIMCIPRQDCLSRMIVNLQDAGFETGFTSMYHTFAQGFPKAENISKSIDRKLGVQRTVVGKKMVDIGIQKGSMHAGRDTNVVEVDDTIATSPQAKALDGSYTYNPKPAIEVILVVMKPLERKTYVEQAMDNQKGVVWFDDCRIPVDPDVDDHRLGGKGTWSTGKMCKNTYEGGYAGERVGSSPAGRFTANLLVSNDILNNGIEWKSGSNVTGIEPSVPAKNVYGEYERRSFVSYGDTGSFSRFFSLDAWWSNKIKNLPESVQKTFPFFLVAKASAGERNNGIEPGCENHHPSVKPLTLMSYLVTLGSRPGDTILEPFLGSGTTAIACKILNRKCIAFEISHEYIQIAISRQNLIQTKLL